MLLASGAMLSACAAPGDETIGRYQHELQAFCQATVGGALLDVETDYLPHVINCENGAADLEALKAQAVSARSYLYYSLELYGMIGDSTGSQVYSCGKTPQAIHYQAVEETSGEVLRYQGTQVAAFFVAGSLQDGPDCTGGTNDPTGTENFVTYNEGLSGADIEQTTLGWVSPSNLANRGCLSQNGSHCLSLEGYQHQEILRFYYGEDIEITQAEGPCVTAQDPPSGADAGPAEAGPDGGRDAPFDEGPASMNGDDPGDAPENLVGGCRAGGGSSGAGALCAALFLGLAVLRRRRA